MIKISFKASNIAILIFIILKFKERSDKNERFYNSNRSY